jgi:hypothetical protein
LLAIQMPAPLGEQLIFQMTTREASSLHRANRASHIGWFAKAGIDVNNRRQIHGTSNRFGALDHFRERRESNVRQTQIC